MKGAPLRFVAVVIGGWTALRVVVLWPGAPPPVRSGTAAVAGRAPPLTHVSRDVVPVPSQLSFPGAGRGPVTITVVSESPLAFSSAAQLGPGLRRGRNDVAGALSGSLPGVPRSQLAAAPGIAPTPAEELVPETYATEMPPRQATGLRSRLRGDAWLIARGGGGDNLAFGQLGASQAGARLTYAVDSVRRLALSGRLSAPLRGGGAEAAAGLDWRPIRLPLHLLVEERVPLDGGRARPAAQLIAGGVARLPLDFRAEGYGQAGAVLRRGGFADGAARVSHILLHRLDLGIGAWGAAQRGVARFDVGPTMSLALPAAGARIAVDYRLRVAGRARPGSGPTVSLGSSF